MRVLFLTSSTEDYLADSLLHGLRRLLGEDVVDYPKSEILYNNCSWAVKKQVRGNGFTLYSGLLEDIQIDRYDVFGKAANGFFDLVVFSNIWRQFGMLYQIYPTLATSRVVFLDGEDSPCVYPYAGRWLRDPFYWNIARVDRNHLYFKREWTEQSRFSILAKISPSRLLKLLPNSRSLRRIAFSIPEEKIIVKPPGKSKDFPKHIVDPELASLIPGSSCTYAFQEETDYYNDLQNSRFGITTKRSGWDCMRHYEIAANGTVPCFRSLRVKPQNCAPHGLCESNCISYDSASELENRISRISQDEYASMQIKAISWAKSNSTRNRAVEFIQQVEKIS